MKSRRKIELAVRQRAADRCEYCRMHQSLQGASFHLEHVVPRIRGGTSELENLAWACPGCNLHKADRVEAIDPETSVAVLLFNPRSQPWTVHFRWNDFEVVGLTATGRATVAILRLNSPRRILIRQVETAFGLFVFSG
jgi:hypothetical protein